MWESFKNFATGLFIRPLKEFADGVFAYLIFFGVWALCLVISGVVVGIPLLIILRGHYEAPAAISFVLSCFMLSSWLGTLGQNVSITNLRSKPLNNKMKGE